MSTQRPTATKAPTVPAPSRSEAARPPKPALQPDVPESERSAYRNKLDQFKRWWQDTIAELKKVTWPDRETTKNLTLVVIAISIVLGALLGAIDWLMQQIFAVL
ncbi:MAG: preprotein translocase subunit SecE [Chloroflexia bacterium]|nr:preprotein translocase subunit SecE [Chloroflexia bacterium]